MYENKKIILPSARRMLISAGDFKFLLEFFVVALFVTKSPYPYFASLSAALALPIYLALMPKITEKINALKSPLNRILLPFALSAVAICPLFVQAFRLHILAKPLQIIYIIVFLPLFFSFTSLMGYISVGLGRSLSGDGLYETTKKAVRGLCVVAIFALAYFFYGKMHLVACLVAIAAAIGFLIEYMSVYDFSSRFKPQTDIVANLEIYEVLGIAAILSLGVIIGNSTVYCLYEKGRLACCLSVGGFALVSSLSVLALKAFQRYALIMEKIVRISTLAGIFVAGLIISLRSKEGVVIATVAVSVLLLVAAILFIFLSYKKNKGENHD